MAYHRDKMHEYLCKQYLAEEIVAAERGEMGESRADTAQLLQDAGSEGYKDWLARWVLIAVCAALILKKRQHFSKKN